MQVKLTRTLFIEGRRFRKGVHDMGNIPLEKDAYPKSAEILEPAKVQAMEKPKAAQSKPEPEPAKDSKSSS